VADKSEYIAATDVLSRYGIAHRKVQKLRRQGFLKAYRDVADDRRVLFRVSDIEQMLQRVELIEPEQSATARA
jgi:DNA-binding MarR family transcriptional regulator